MKGRLSPTLGRVLRDPTAREQLRSALLNGEGRVELDGVTYVVTTSRTRRRGDWVWEAQLRPWESILFAVLLGVTFGVVLLLLAA